MLLRQISKHQWVRPISSEPIVILIYCRYMEMSLLLVLHWILIHLKCKWPVTLAMRWLILFWKIWKKQSDFFLKQMRLAVKMKVVCLVRLRVLFFLVSLFMKVLGKSFVMVDRTMIVQAHYWI